MMECIEAAPNIFSGFGCSLASPSKQLRSGLVGYIHAHRITRCSGGKEDLQLAKIVLSKDFELIPFKTSKSSKGILVGHKTRQGREMMTVVVTGAGTPTRAKWPAGVGKAIGVA